MENYLKIADKWHRYDSARLDWLCEWQRIERLWNDDSDFHCRKRAVVSSFWWHVNSGKSRDEAYYLACQTQLLGLNPVALLNVDARTTWITESDRADWISGNRFLVCGASINPQALPLY